MRGSSSTWLRQGTEIVMLHRLDVLGLILAVGGLGQALYAAQLLSI